MEKNAHYFIVGIFVTGALAALVGFVMWLASPAGGMREHDRYTVSFSDSVDGLEEGAKVRYKGVDIGRVIDMRIDTDSGVVKADIEVSKETPVRANTTAAIEMQGITGVAHLQLATNLKDSRLPPEVEGEKYPVLKGSGSTWAKVMEDLPVITQQIRGASGKLNNLLGSKRVRKLAGD